MTADRGAASRRAGPGRRRGLRYGAPAQEAMASHGRRRRSSFWIAARRLLRLFDQSGYVRATSRNQEGAHP